MFDPKAFKNQKSTTLLRKSTPPTVMPSAPKAAPSHDEISQRAYELYEGGGRQDGGDQRDWLAAEHEILVRCR
jgi:hypothetical protein